MKKICKNCYYWNKSEFKVHGCDNPNILELSEDEMWAEGEGYYPEFSCRFWKKKNEYKKLTILALKEQIEKLSYKIETDLKAIENHNDIIKSIKFTLKENENKKQSLQTLIRNLKESL